MAMQRRTFLKKTGSTVACACLACTGVLQSPDRHLTQYDADSFRVEDSKLIIDLNKHPKLKEVGGSETLPAANKKIIVLHPDEQIYKAFENKCTHQGGPLSYRHKDGFMQCALHGSRFDADGRVVRGPAAQSLTEFRTSLDNNLLTVYLS